MTAVCRLIEVIIQPEVALMGGRYDLENCFTRVAPPRQQLHKKKNTSNSRLSQCDGQKAAASGGGDGGFF